MTREQERKMSKLLKPLVEEIVKKQKLVETTGTLLDGAKKGLKGRRITDVGKDYITIDSGLNIYLDESEIDNINGFYE